MLARIILLGALMTGPMPLLPGASLASDNGAAGERWHFVAGVGLEGQAYVVGEGAFRIEVECGNGGGPAITLGSSSPSMLAWGGKSKRVFMQFEIDGKRFDEDFECHPDGMSCGSFGFPTDRLISAMRQGSRMVVRHGDTFHAEFTLRGSSAAISRLSACLGPSFEKAN